MPSISDQRFDFGDIPNVVLVPKGRIQNALLTRRAIQRFTRPRIAFICQLAVTVDGVVPTLLEFSSD